MNTIRRVPFVCVFSPKFPYLLRRRIIIVTTTTTTRNAGAVERVPIDVSKIAGRPTLLLLRAITRGGPMRDYVQNTRRRV